MNRGPEKHGESGLVMLKNTTFENIETNPKRLELVFRKAHSESERSHHASGDMFANVRYVCSFLLCTHQ